MKSIYFTPGPSQLYRTVPIHIKTAIKTSVTSLSHRSVLFEQIYKNTQQNLIKLFKIPRGYKLFFLSSSLESMERTIQNCVQRYSHHFVNGSFSKKYYQMSLSLGKNASKYTVGVGEGFNFDKVSLPKKTELICVTQNETSTGVSIPLNSIYNLKNKYSQVLLSVDIVSSAPIPDINLSKLDLAFFSVQKAFGLPSGLSVLIISPKAFSKAKSLLNKGYLIGSYHSFVELDKYALSYQTPETPNILNMYLLGKVTEDFLKIGIDRLRKESKIKSDLLYNFFDQHPKYQPFVKEKEIRSETVVVVNTGTDTKQIMDKLKSKGLIVGNGYGEFKGRQIRISNFPAHRIKDIKFLLDTIK